MAENCARASCVDMRVGFVTTDQTWKAKRIRNDNRVRLQACDSRGRPTAGSSPVDGTAEIVHGSEWEAVRAAVAAKYGWQFKAIAAFEKIRDLFKKQDAGDECAIIVTLAE